MPKGYIGQYKGERYHIPDFQRNRHFYSNNERFKYYHSSLRGTNERSFGVRKKRFKIVRDMPSYLYDAQVKIVIATMAVHNFIRRNAHIDVDLDKYDQKRARLQQVKEKEVKEEEGVSSCLSQVPSTFEPSREMILLRDCIRDELASN